METPPRSRRDDSQLRCSTTARGSGAWARVAKLSDPIAIGDVWYLVSPQEKIASTIPDFSAVKDDAEKKRRNEKAEQLAKERADTILAKVKETKNLATVAAEQKLTVEETGAFTRQGGYIPKIGAIPDLKKAAFQLTPETPIVPQVYTWSSNAFVAVLHEKTTPSEKNLPNKKRSVNNSSNANKTMSSPTDSPLEKTLDHYV